MKTLIALIALTAAFSAHADVGLATGSSSGTYYAIGQDIKRTCTNINVQVYESAGSLSNLDRIFADSKVQYGIVQSDALVYKDLSDHILMQKIKQIFPLYNEEINIIVNTKSGINKFEDLAGKKVVIGSSGSGNWVTANIIKAKTGIQWTDVEEQPAQSMVGLVTGEYDAAIVVAGKPIKFFQDLGASAANHVKLIPFTNPAVEGFYVRSSVPEGIYAWQTKPIQTYAVKSVMATYDYKNPVMGQEIGKLVSCIVKNLPQLQQTGHPKWKEVDPLQIDQVNWPIHPEALKAIKANR
jgi:TRAP transporter TAXI family solute receptor